jgi:hypothetical protein
LPRTEPGAATAEGGQTARMEHLSAWHGATATGRNERNAQIKWQGWGREHMSCRHAGPHPWLPLLPREGKRQGWGLWKRWGDGGWG